MALALYAGADRLMWAAPTSDGAAWADLLFRRLLRFAWGLLALMYVPYFWHSYYGQPVAGLGTAAGHPDDRPRLSPSMMRMWELQQGAELLDESAR